MRIVAVRHGETEWSKIGQHTGRTDLPLTTNGEIEAQNTGDVLRSWNVSRAFSSPLQRAANTAALAGFPDAELVDDLMEWDYGHHEGQRTADIIAETPSFSKWTHRPPGGESVEEVGARADRFLLSLVQSQLAGDTEENDTDLGDTDLGDTDLGDIVVFAHGHFLAILIARWLELPATKGRLFPLKTATVSVLGTYQGRPVLRSLNSECPT